MKQITFAELREFVNVETKELRVPNPKKILEHKTKPVIHGRFGKFDEIRISKNGEEIFSSNRTGIFEEVTLFPTGGYLAGNDMSVISREIIIRSEDGGEMSFSSEGVILQLIVDGSEIPDGLWISEMERWESPEIRKYISEVWGMDPSYIGRNRPYYAAEDFFELMEKMTEITVFTDGNVIYSAGGGNSVFALCKCCEYEYVTVTDTVRIQRNALDMLPWHVRLTMMGDDRKIKNSSNKKKEVLLFDDSEEGDSFQDVVAEFFRMGRVSDDVWELMLELEEEKRKVILLYFFDCDKQEVIAKKLHISRETVSRRIKRILGEMKELYAEMNGKKG